MDRTAPRLVVALTAIGLAALALPANAAAPSYAPGDVVTVDGASVTAPAPGNSVALYVDRITGDSTTLMVTTSADGTVTVSDGSEAATAAVPAAPNKCSDSAYSLSPYNGAKWRGTYNWRFKSGSTPNELTKKAATQALKQSMGNITGADNNCGLKDQVSAKASYKGSTNQGSDVTAEPACVANPNGQNVTEFGPMGGGGILAATCVYGFVGDKITEASVRINTNFRWWIKGSCSNAYGLKAVQTHEYGHAFGVGHVDEQNHGNLTMSTNINSDCSNFEASLGRGDVLALRKLY